MLTRLAFAFVLAAPAVLAQNAPAQGAIRAGASAEPGTTTLRIERGWSWDCGPTVRYVLNGEVLSNDAIASRHLRSEDVVSVRVLPADEARERFGDLAENPIVEIITTRPPVEPPLAAGEPVQIRLSPSSPPAGFPLYKLDGRMVEVEALNALNPDDIQTVEVVRGGEALACYGAAGAYGVVRVVTKADARRTRSAQAP